MPEALIFESVSPQYDKRLFIESPQKYKFRTCCVEILFWMSNKNKKQFLNTTCSKLVFFGGIQWTISHGLTDARMRVSEKDLPVLLSILDRIFSLFQINFPNFVIILIMAFLYWFFSNSVGLDWRLYNQHNWTIGCVNEHPNGYSKIVNYLDWITSVTGINFNWSPKTLK